MGLHKALDALLARIERQNSKSAKLLELWACFDNQDLWFELLAKGRSDGPAWFKDLTADPPSFHEAVGVLCDYGLVESHTCSTTKKMAESPGYTMHKCVHSWAMHALKTIKNGDLVLLALRCFSGRSADHNKPVWARLRQHAFRGWNMIVDGLAAQTQGADWLLFNDLGAFFDNLGEPAKAESMFDRAVQLYETLSEEERGNQRHPCYQYRNLGRKYEARERHTEAAAMYQLALPSHEKLLGADHPLTLELLRSLGGSSRMCQKHEQAEDALLRALGGYQKIFGQGHEQTILTLRDLGILYQSQGRHEEAITMNTKALEGYVLVYGADHEETVRLRDDLRVLYKQRAMNEEAIARNPTALRGNEQAHGQEHSKALTVVNSPGYEQARREADSEDFDVVKSLRDAVSPEMKAFFKGALVVGGALVLLHELLESDSDND
jgi:tetratricopeptide (TPR) repeat protein